jgi:ketosteroid isomerase-like protein
MADDLRERLLDGYAAWNRGDLEGWLAMMHPDVELDAPGIFPGFDRRYYGHDGLKRFWRQLNEPWEEFRIDVEAIDEEPNGFVVAIRFRAKGTGSGVDVDMPFGHALRVQDGLAAEIIARGSAAEARQALRALAY